MLKALRRGPSERGPGFKAGVAVGACLAFLALSALRAAAPAAGPAHALQQPTVVISTFSNSN